MRVEVNLSGVPLERLAEVARAVEGLGVDGIAEAEIRRDPFVALAVEATATSRVLLAPSVALAFPRSPMVVAYTARTLQDLSRGRFVLGLGTQVKGHIERRFSVPWDAPGPRLREYVRALRAIWRAWQEGEPLDFRGRFYQFTLMTPEFNPGPSPFGPPPVQIAAVNPYNLETAGRLCDGLRLHPLTSPEYLRDVVWPQVRAGAERAGRSLEEFQMVGGGFIATGATEAEVGAAREWARERVAFYASTRSYLPVLAHHGWESVNPRLRRLIAEGRWSDLAAVIPDELLDAFCLAGTYDEIPGVIERRLGGLVDWVTLPLPNDPDDLAEREGALRRVVAALHQVPDARGRRADRPVGGDEVA